MSLMESGQRRIDVVEFVKIAEALEADPRIMFDQLIDEMNIGGGSGVKRNEG